MGCQDEECKKSIISWLKEHNTVLYGQDKRSGLVADTNVNHICLTAIKREKVSNVKLYTTIGCILIGIISLSSPFVNHGLRAYADEKDKVAHIQSEQAVIKVQVKTIQANIAEIKTDIRIIKAQQISKEDLKKIVTEALHSKSEIP